MCDWRGLAIAYPAGGCRAPYHLKHRGGAPRCLARRTSLTAAQRSSMCPNNVQTTLSEFAACLARAGTMAEKACTIRTRKFLTNPLLGRKQFVRTQQLPAVVVADAWRSSALRWAVTAW